MRKGGVLMEEENGTVFRNFFFSILKEYVCVCGKGEGKYLGSIIYIYMSSSEKDRSKREINCFFGAESLNNTLPRIRDSKSNLSHRYFIASISRHIHQPVSTPLNSLSFPLDLPPPPSSASSIDHHSAISLSGWNGNT